MVSLEMYRWRSLHGGNGSRGRAEPLHTLGQCSKHRYQICNMLAGIVRIQNLLHGLCFDALHCYREFGFRKVRDCATITGCLGLAGMGLALHGGSGLSCRAFGVSADSILSAKVVTADGNLVQPSHLHNCWWFCLLDWTLR